jgi:hypothetical protein
LFRVNLINNPIHHNAEEIMGGWKITMQKDRATWTYFTTNPQGGSFGSNYCGPMYIALARAQYAIPAGEVVCLEVNGKQRPNFVKS